MFVVLTSWHSHC